ncbi:MAG: exo-alpha-sialidase [Candidatus Acetothermia bacterium]|nr:exo-alpha-sialidase [Candidatus Acetothermia bacterium]MDH7505653.1 exo-alpha-sialidase [Candidatus Acetothermia bacterium]
MEALDLTRRYIPAPPSHPTCHAPSLCELPGGELLLAFYAGSREGAPDSVVLGARFDPERSEWSSPEVWVDVPGRAPANPRIFLGPDGAVWLLVGINYGPRWCSGETYLFLKRSFDLGRTWRDLELFWEEKGLLGKNKPLHLREVWLIPVEWEREWSAAFLRSEDNGATWEIVGDLGKEAGAHLIQPALVPLADGRLMAYMRSQERYIFVAYSPDLGKSWTRPQPTPLPNNNSGIDMERLDSGSLVLAFNPTTPVPGLAKLHQGWPEVMPAGFDVWGPRTPLVLALSQDEGKTWPYRLALEEGPGEFSYPAIIQDEQGIIHVAYTYNRKAICHVQLTEEQLLARLEGE